MKQLILIFFAFFLTSCNLTNISNISDPHSYSKNQKKNNIYTPMIKTYRISGTYEKAQPQPTNNLRILVDRADDLMQSGDFRTAAPILERCIRISPRDPFLWHKLAQLRLKLNQYDLAEKIAKKSNSLNTNDADLRNDNWLIINQSRSLRHSVATPN